ncbi:Toll/interleukin-1 receptor domain-containing protein [Tanacetum coccineum]|uniref:Toll/interleukin-1 receptor domain-containing protein n=1 Tax=Tanacetum coccineum TaxID=301880 RepID=A0ABQ5BJL5_9ASTR
MMEIELLSTYKHENIVSLVRYYGEGMHKILVYRYEKNGSLEHNLIHKKKDLKWIQRLQICLDAAHGLEYLHDDVQHQHIIIHRAQTSYWMRLGRQKYSILGCAKFLVQIYVYSFGIVILEVLFGRLVKNTAKNPSEEYLNERRFYAKLAQNHYEKEKLDEIIESDLQTQMNSDSLTTFSSITYQCLKNSKEERPTMSQVVDQLEKALDYQHVASKI